MKRKRQFKKHFPTVGILVRSLLGLCRVSHAGISCCGGGTGCSFSKITIENFRCFGEGANRFELPFRCGLTALVGENEAGKTAVVDALRFVLGTTDQEWYRLDDTDFHAGGTSRRNSDCLRIQRSEPTRQKGFRSVPYVRE